MNYRKAILVAAATAVAALVVAAVAFAANVHFKGEPTFRDQGTTLNATGTLVGLGNGDVDVTVTPTGSATTVCTNPSGSNNPPGAQPETTFPSGTQSIPDNQVKNGNVAFNVTSTEPESPVPGAPDCPNSHWTETITDVAFTGATIEVQQNGHTVLTSDCTFSSPTSDGRVPAGNVTCQ